MNAQSKVEAATLASAMTLQERIVPAGEYPNYFASWNRECEANRKLWALLSRAAMLLESEAARRERDGEDVAHLRAFIAEARSA